MLPPGGCWVLSWRRRTQALSEVCNLTGDLGARTFVLGSDTVIPRHQPTFSHLKRMCRPTVDKGCAVGVHGLEEEGVGWGRVDQGREGKGRRPGPNFDPFREDPSLSGKALVPRVP